jgi:protein-disulfide isomerase
VRCPQTRRDEALSNQTPDTPNLSSRRERRRAERAARGGRPRQRPTATRRSPWRSPLVLITGLAVLAGLVLVAFTALTAPRGVEPGSTALVEPPISPPAVAVAGETLGAADSPVVLEVYSDFQCPVCGRFAREYLPVLIRDFVEPGQLRIVDRGIDILGRGDPNESLDAGAAAVCAGQQNRYWDYHNWLFWNQRGENRGAFARDRLTTIAESIGLDVPAWQACFSGGGAAQEVQAQTAAATAAGITSTPTFVINGERTVGLPRTYEELATKIRAAIP